MRLVVLLGVSLIALSPEARAADYGPLRGSQVEVVGGATWNGVYVGGHTAVNSYSGDFGGGTGSLIAHMLRNTTIENENRISEWTTLGTADSQGTGFGGFIGYNMQFEDVVVGVEANYTRTNVRLSASDNMGRMFGTSDGYTNNVFVDSSASVLLTDYATLRLRGGWAYGNFLPYGFIGAALGRATVTRSARVVASGTHGGGNPPYSFDQTATEAKADDLAYGIAGGFGVEFAVFQNLFVRAEYEFIKFGLFNDLNTYLQTARVGAGVKF
jgi:opacity protein-like surface antigen